MAGVQGDSTVQQGLAALREKRVADAIGLLAQAAQTNPHDFDVAYGLGVALGMNSQLAESAQWLNFAVSLRPDSVSALYNLGQVHFKLNDMPQAKAALDRALVVQPDHARAQQLLKQIGPVGAPAPMSAVPQREQTASVSGGDRCPKCGAMNPQRYRVCNLCGAPATSAPTPAAMSGAMSALRAADAQEASRQARRAAEDRKEQEQAKHTLTIMAVIAAGLMAADVVRILHAAQAGTTVGIISATVLEVAIPFIVSIVVFNTYEAVKQGQSVVMASLATAVAMVIALKLFGLVVRPMFAIFKGVPYSGTVQYGIMFLFVYISLMVALERVARTRLDYSDTIIRAISIPTFILLIVTTIGLALIMPGPKKDDADEEDDATVTEETKSGDTEEAPPETETKDSDSDSGE